MNMLFHMNLIESAVEFRRIASLPPKLLLEAMGVSAFPKKLRDIRHGIDPIEKCVWILERKYNCRRFGYLNPMQFITAAKLVENLRQVQLPIILSVVGKNSIFNHVVIVWRGDVIDFEEKAKYPLSIVNVDRICGPKNQFVKISRGYVILPSRMMKSAVGDSSDWGEKHLKEHHSHLFRKSA